MGNAQQDAQYSLNCFNQMSINPGYSGSQNAIDIQGIFRDQWMGFDNAPNTQQFSIHSPFNLFEKKHGVGLVILNDEIGFYKNVGLKASYAYRKDVGQGELGTGFGVGFVNNVLSDVNWITPETDTDPSIPVGGDDNTPMVFNIDIGAFYQTEKLYLGISASNINKPSVKFDEFKGTSASENYPFVKPHFYITAGYYYQLLNPLFEIEPSMLIKSDGVSTQLDITALMHYNKRFFGGLSYRTVDAVSAIFGMDFQNGIKFAAAYDFTTSQISNATSGSFEFMLGYSFSIDVEKDKRLYKSIRFL